TACRYPVDRNRTAPASAGTAQCQFGTIIRFMCFCSPAQLAQGVEHGYRGFYGTGFPVQCEPDYFSRIVARLEFPGSLRTAGHTCPAPGTFGCFQGTCREIGAKAAPQALFISDGNKTGRRHFQISLTPAALFANSKAKLSQKRV